MDEKENGPTVPVAAGKQGAQKNADRKITTRRRFSGTTNSRHLRAIEALERGPVFREMLDRIAGCANGPELIAELRRRGLEAPCKRVPIEDRDGKICHPGLYSLTSADQLLIAEWTARYNRGGGDEA